MNVVILQPSYVPWRGYFHQIRKADIFVFYDCVQYDNRGWRNRNRIKTAQGLHWLSIPVNAKGAQTHATPIKDISIVWDSLWSKKHMDTLRRNYAKAPFYQRYASLLEEYYARHDEKLADFTCDLIVALARELGLNKTQFLRSSALPAHGAKTDRLLSILTHLGATHYISGPSARDYIDAEKFAAAGVTLEYLSYNYPEYPQLHGAFESQLSVLDLLFNTGPEAPQYIWP